MLILFEVRLEISQWKSVVAQLLTEGRTIEIQASGYSMFPLLRPGDKLQVHPRVESIKSGDIIVFDRGDVFVAHRLLEVQGDVVLCKGDGFAFYDSPISLRQVVGKVSHRSRNERSIDLSERRYVWFGKLMLLFPRAMGFVFSYFAKVYIKFLVD